MGRGPCKIGEQDPRCKPRWFFFRVQGDQRALRQKSGRDSALLYDGRAPQNDRHPVRTIQGVEGREANHQQPCNVDISGESCRSRRMETNFSEFETSPMLEALAQDNVSRGKVPPAGPDGGLCQSVYDGEPGSISKHNQAARQAEVGPQVGRCFHYHTHYHTHYGDHGRLEKQPKEYRRAGAHLSRRGRDNIGLTSKADTEQFSIRLAKGYPKLLGKVKYAMRSIFNCSPSYQYTSHPQKSNRSRPYLSAKTPRYSWVHPYARTAQVQNRNIRRASVQ